MNCCFRVSLLLVLAVISAPAKEKAGPQIYSDVRYITEGGGGPGDLIGTELQLKIEGTEATGILRIYQGGCAEQVRVIGSYSGNAVHVSGEGQGYGKVEITGKLQHSRLDGSLRLERDHSTVKIRLKRTSKPHC
jgi:hypothetical protein